MEVAEYFLPGPKQRDLVIVEIREAIKEWRRSALTHGIDERELNRFADVFDRHPLGFRSRS